jgi:hypothetical protein
MNYINNLEELAEGKNREFLSANRELFSPNREITGIAAFAHQRTAVMILAGAPSHRVQSATTASGQRVKVNTSLLHRRFMYSGIVAKKPFVPGERLGSPNSDARSTESRRGYPRCLERLSAHQAVIVWTACAIAERKIHGQRLGYVAILQVDELTESPGRSTFARGTDRQRPCSRDQGPGGDSQAMPQTTAIRVTYRFIDGLHVYTSEDVYGLYVANQDPQRAYDAVAPSLQKLICLNEGMNCRVEPALTYSELLRSVHHPDQPLVPEITSRSFVAHAA